MSALTLNNSGIKKPTYTPAPPSDRAQRHQSRNLRREAITKDPPSQFTTPTSNDNRNNTSVNSNAPYPFPDIDTVINTPQSPGFSRRLDARIDAQRDYFESKYSQKKRQICAKTGNT